jgi:hypothetical protein
MSYRPGSSCWFTSNEGWKILVQPSVNLADTTRAEMITPLTNAELKSEEDEETK